MNELAEAERAAIDRVLAFANLERVSGVEAVYAIFEPAAAAPRLYVLRDDDTAVPLWFQRLHAEPEPGDAAVLHGNLSWLETMLQEFIDTPQKARRSHGARIAQLVGKGALLAVPTFAEGRIRHDLRFITSGLEASCGYALALLYDRSKPYGKALRRCAWVECGKWFLSFPRGGGPEPQYCETDHQRAADKARAVARAREWRKDQAAKAAKHK